MADISDDMLEVIFKEVLREISPPARRLGRGRPNIPLDSMVKAFILI